MPEPWPKSDHNIMLFDSDFLHWKINFSVSGVNALKFESKETNSIRLCRKIGDIFEPPEDGWGDRLYIVHSPMSQNVSTSGKFYVL